MLKKTLSEAFVKVMDQFAVNRVLVLGDSHAQVFSHYIFKTKFPFIHFDICSINGATASGLENPNSKTKAYSTFTEKLNSTKVGERVIVLLGEIDTGFLIWYRARKYNLSIDEMLNQSVENYIKFLEGAKSNRKLIVLSCPLPTIQDNDAFGEIAILRKEVKVSQSERTQLALTFNLLVKEKCVNSHIVFVDLDPFSLDRNGLVCTYLLNENRLNHHYNPKAYAKLLCTELRKVIQ
jgi:hypothetical protein